MDSQGQRGSNPKAMLTSLLGKRQKLQEELRTIEKQVYELETSYLQESSNFGNIWKGFEGFLSSSKNTTKSIAALHITPGICSTDSHIFTAIISFARALFLHKKNLLVEHFSDKVLITLWGSLKRSKKFQLEDRLFSLSSVTSPAAEELGIGREDGKSDMGQGRLKGGALATNGQGKPKKGRTGPRDGKKFRLSSDLDPDDEDDPDMSLR